MAHWVVQSPLYIHFLGLRSGPNFGGPNSNFGLHSKIRVFIFNALPSIASLYNFTIIILPSQLYYQSKIKINLPDLVNSALIILHPLPSSTCIKSKSIHDSICKFNIQICKFTIKLFCYATPFMIKKKLAI